MPGSELHANAQYDAAGLLIEAGDWPSAIGVLTDFRARFPAHPLIDTVPAKLALAYRETGQWALAGDEVSRLSELAQSPEEQRENLSIAAGLYDRSGDTDRAIDAWRRYANRYPEPVPAYLEAAHRLAELYQARGDIPRRDYWLEKQMVRVERLGDDADDRMRYLAASAAATLAREALARYQGIRLTLPLDRSMVAKTEALEAAVTAYQRMAAFGVAELASEAGYQIADIYARLARDLMDSERPPGLNELELEQYELLLEEQAYPFEDNAIDIHEQNIRKAQQGIYDEWVRRSYEALRRLLPGRYDKTEIRPEVVDELANWGAVAVLLCLAGCAGAPRQPAAPAAPDPDQARLEADFAQAVAAMKAGDRDTARAGFQRLLEAHPERTGPRANLAILAYEEGDAAAAGPVSRRCWHRRPNTGWRSTTWASWPASGAISRPRKPTIGGLWRRRRRSRRHC